MPDNRTSPWLNALITAAAPVIWGSTYIVTTELLPPERPFTAALLRTLPAGLLLVLWCRRWPAWGDWTGWWRLLVLAALNIGVFQALLFVAAYRLPGGVAAVVGAIGPLVVMGLTWALDHRRPPALALAAGAVGVAGMAALLLAPGARWDMLGVAAALAGTLCMAAGTFWSRRWRPSLPVLAFTGWQLLAGGVMLAPWAWWLDPPLPTLTATHVGGLPVPEFGGCSAVVRTVVQGRGAIAIGGRVIAAVAQPCHGSGAGLGVAGPSPAGPVAGGYVGGAGKHFGGAMGDVSARSPFALTID